MNILALLAVASTSLLSANSFDRSRDLEHRAIVEPHQRIEIRGFSGSHIEFRTWDRNEVAITVTARVSSSDEKYEEEYINSLEIRESKTASTLLLELREQEGGPRGSFWSLFRGGSYVKKEIRGEVYIPRTNPLTLNFRYGTIALEGMKGELNIHGKNNNLSLKDCEQIRTVENDYGTSEILTSGGTLGLRGTSSTVTISSFSGKAAIDAPYSTIRISDLTGGGVVNSQSGTVTVANVGGDLTVNADYSRITATDIRGMVAIATQSGTVRVRKTLGLRAEAPYTKIEAGEIDATDRKPVVITNQSGSIALDQITGDVVLDCPYTGVDLKSVTGSVEIRSKSSTIRATDVKGDWKSQTEYSTLRLRGLTAKSIMVVNKSNRVDLEALAIPERMEIRNEYGSVDVTLPRGFSGSVDLDAEYGSIETDLPVTVRKRSSSAIAIGTVGSGRGAITIQTKSGNIGLTQR